MEYRLITASHYDDVIKHLRDHFPDEPLNASVGLSIHGQPCPLLEKYNMVTMHEGLSVMALDTKTGEVAGACLNGTARKGDIEKSLENMKKIDNVEYHRIFGLLNEVNKEADLFNKYKLDKIFDLRILSVDPKYRGKGLAKELFSRSEIVAIEHGFKMMKVDATSLYTQKVCESFGLETEKTICYADYKDEKGQRIYKTPPPHETYKLMIKTLPARKDND